MTYSLKFSVQSLFISVFYFLDSIFARESVLEHFVDKVKCRGMFSTHYHRLAVDYKKDPRVCLCIFLQFLFFSFAFILSLTEVFTSWPATEGENVKEIINVYGITIG